MIMSNKLHPMTSHKRQAYVYVKSSTSGISQSFFPPSSSSLSSWATRPVATAADCPASHQPCSTSSQLYHRPAGWQRLRALASSGL